MSDAGAHKREDKGRGSAIEIRDLQVELGGVEILAGVNAVIRESEITALIGPNGAGKTTLLLCILGMVPFKGELRLLQRGGRPVIGYVPQQLEFDRGMPVTVLDFMSLGRQRMPVWLGHSPSQRGAIKETLAWVKAEHLLKRRLGNLSGGEMQRVLLAKAMLEGPDIIMLDEPASAVDRTGEELFMKLIRELHDERHLTILMVSHDLSMVTRIANQVICLNRTVLSEGRTADVLSEKSLSACFGSDKGILMHEHGWGAELSCAYDEDGKTEENE